MKQTKLIMAVVVIALVASVGAFAQAKPGLGEKRGTQTRECKCGEMCRCGEVCNCGAMCKCGEEMRETIEMWRFHKMREALALTPSQSDAALRAEESKKQRERALIEKADAEFKNLRNALTRNASDRELQTSVDILRAIHDEKQKIEKDFHAEMRKILNTRQQAEFVLFQRDFQREMRQKIHRVRAERAERKQCIPPPMQELD